MGPCRARASTPVPVRSVVVLLALCTVVAGVGVRALPYARPSSASGGKVYGSARHDSHHAASRAGAALGLGSGPHPPAPRSLRPNAPAWERLRGHDDWKGRGRGKVTMILTSGDDVDFEAAIADMDTKPVAVSPIFKGESWADLDSVTEESPATQLCAVCQPHIGNCGLAYYGKQPGRFCGLWVTLVDHAPQRHVACCPPNSQCAVNVNGMYTACVSQGVPGASRGDNQGGASGSAGTASVGDALRQSSGEFAFGVQSVAGSVPWMAAWCVCDVARDVARPARRAGVC